MGIRPDLKTNKMENSYDHIMTPPRVAANDKAMRYDRLSIALHWATAVLVFLVFGLEEVRTFFLKPERHQLDKVHISFGLLLMAILAIRIIWRLTSDHKVRGSGVGVMAIAAKAVHYVLYVLLAVQAVLGILTRWTDNHALTFFGLLIPSPFGPFSKATSNLVYEIHNIVAWIFMGLVAAHAAAALFHHFIVRDDILTRMLPLRQQPHAKP